MLNTSRRLIDKNSLTWWYVLKTSWRYLSKTSWRRLEDVLNTSWQDVLKMSWRCLQNVLKTSWRCLEDVLRTFWSVEDVWPRSIYWSWPRRLEDVFCRRMAKSSKFVLMKTSSEDEDERRFQDVFIKTNVWWDTIFLNKNLMKRYFAWKISFLIFWRPKNSVLKVS